MSENQSQQSAMIRRQVLEDMGIPVPDDASRFYTENTSIFFLIPVIEEIGNSIVFNEETIEDTLTETQIESLKAAGCFGPDGWTIA